MGLQVIHNGMCKQICRLWSSIPPFPHPFMYTPLPPSLSQGEPLPPGVKASIDNIGALHGEAMMVWGTQVRADRPEGGAGRVMGREWGCIK